MDLIRAIDIRTIFILLPLTAVLLGLVLWLGPRSNRREGLSRWIVGLALIAISWLLMASRGYVAPALSVALADGLMMAGLLLQVGALYEFRHGKALTHYSLAPGLLLFLFLLLVPLEFRAYSLIGSFLLSVPLLIMGIQSWNLGASAARFPMAIFYLLGGVLLQARALHIWFAPEADLHFFSSHPLHIVAFVNSFAMTISGSIGFLEMQRWRAEMSIRYYAMYDELTDLLNRRSFFDLAEGERIKAQKSGVTLAVMMLDIDNFKLINDRYGHFTGDHVLASIARAARENLRGNDLLCRSGGEEFMALLVDVDIESAVEIAQNIRGAVQALAMKGIDEPVTMSIGVAACDSLEVSGIELGLRRADAALYQAKNSGRNQVSVAQ